MLKVLQLRFLPGSTDAGLLVLRLWFGLSMLLLHGLSKATGFGKMSGSFPDPLGVGSPVSLGLAVFAEVVCAVLIAVGLFTRAASAVGVILMGVAFFIIHARALSGENSGELAFLYLGAFVVMLISGPGRYSVDAGMGGAR